MRCHRHQSDEAVGVCRACGKGVCDACCIDTTVGLACSDACDTVVRAQRSMMLRARRDLGGRFYMLAALGGVIAIPSALLMLMYVLAGELGTAVIWLPGFLMGIVSIAWARHNFGRPRALSSPKSLAGLPTIAGRLRDGG